jgi:predicted nucleic acid-binding protein
VAVHDASIAATAAVHGIGYLATENPDDFGTCPEIAIVRLAELEDLLSASPGAR